MTTGSYHNWPHSSTPAKGQLSQLRLPLLSVYGGFTPPMGGDRIKGIRKCSSIIMKYPGCGLKCITNLKNHWLSWTVQLSPKTFLVKPYDIYMSYRWIGEPLVQYVVHTGRIQLLLCIRNELKINVLSISQSPTNQAVNQISYQSTNQLWITYNQSSNESSINHTTNQSFNQSK